MTAYLRARWGEATTNHGFAALGVAAFTAWQGDLSPVQIAAVVIYGLLHIFLPEVK
jgi:hypothetical protein